MFKNGLKVFAYSVGTRQPLSIIYKSHEKGIENYFCYHYIEWLPTMLVNCNVMEFNVNATP